MSAYYERYPSMYGYKSGYIPNPSLDENIKDLHKELEILRKIFPKLNKKSYDLSFLKMIENGEIILPEKAERWTLLLKPEAIAENYNLAFKKTFFKLSKSRGRDLSSYSYYRNKLSSEFLKQLDITSNSFDSISEQQPGYDILIVPVQLGLKRQGETVYEIRDELEMVIEKPYEFGLDSLSAAILLITHPERLATKYDLELFCAGDEGDPGKDFVSIFPYFSLEGGKIRYGMLHTSKSSDCSSVISGFIV